MPERSSVSSTRQDKRQSTEVFDLNQILEEIQDSKIPNIFSSVLHDMCRSNAFMLIPGTCLNLREATVAQAVMRSIEDGDTVFVVAESPIEGGVSTGLMKTEHTHYLTLAINREIFLEPARLWETKLRQAAASLHGLDIFAAQNKLKVGGCCDDLRMESEVNWHRMMGY